MWKTKASRTIFQSPSGISVHQNMLYRWLTINSDALQTLINRHCPQSPALPYIQPLITPARLNPGDCCLLGLGGGGVSHALNQDLKGSMMTAVEQNVEIIQIAKQYFFIEKIQPLSIIHQDAMQFVQESQAQFLHILVDLYNANSFPKHCANQSFFSHCKRLLAINGVLAVNLPDALQQKPLFNYIREAFSQHTISLPVPGTANMIVLAIHADTIRPLIDLLAKQFKKLIWDANWGYVAEFHFKPSCNNLSSKLRLWLEP